MSDYKPFDRVEIMPLYTWSSFKFSEKLIRNWNRRLGLMQRVRVSEDHATEIPTRLPYKNIGMPKDYIQVDSVFLEMIEHQKSIDALLKK
jgi:hypothetical protein